MNFDYDSWITQARERLKLLYDQKNAIENEISILEKGIEGVLPLTKNAWLGPTAGLTDSVVKVFSSKSHCVFSVTEVRNELIKKGLSLDQKNPMANIHQVIARLLRKGWLATTIDQGKNRYRWIGEGGKEDVMKGNNAMPMPPGLTTGAPPLGRTPPPPVATDLLKKALEKSKK
jgi:hypothetical protein